MTRETRRSIANGIWACRKCGNLIDSDRPGYTVELLRRWKTDAEQAAKQLLEAGIGYTSERLDLAIPSIESVDSLLAFADTTVAKVGREAELAELTAFLEDDDRAFSWWLWTGPAGMGKSRLALEACRLVSGRWHAGFLRDIGQERLGHLRSLTPTFVVIDYAAQRSAWLSDALFHLTQHDLGAPVRVLVLERDTEGPWWGQLQRHHRLEEASQLAAAQYAKPRALTGLAGEELRMLVRHVAEGLEVPLAAGDVQEIVDHAKDIDPLGRPLFALVATLDWLNGKGVSAGRDEALRRLVDRANSQMANAVDPGLVSQARNVWFLASTLGGLTVERYAHLLDLAETPTGLLPSVFGALPAGLDHLLDGFRPDILGELLVLDRLGGVGAERLTGQALLNAAWQVDSDAYRAFVARTAADHGEHPNLVDLLLVDVEPPSAWAWLAADTIPLLGGSNHSIMTTILTKLAELEGSSDVDEPMVTAQFRFANLIWMEGDSARANELFTDALASSSPLWTVHASIVNNRGITWIDLDHTDLAIADFTQVIESEIASDEIRACALNNRADVYEGSDLPAAIIDRSAVLALAQTTYDRRYIALARRARALVTMQDILGAYRDLTAILNTPDIAIEQKMETRLYRAELHYADGSVAEAVADLQTVLKSYRNFSRVEERARALLLDFTGAEAEGVSDTEQDLASG